MTPLKSLDAVAKPNRIILISLNCVIPSNIVFVPVAFNFHSQSSLTLTFTRTRGTTIFISISLHEFILENIVIHNSHPFSTTRIIIPFQGPSPGNVIVVTPIRGNNEKLIQINIECFVGSKI